MSYTVETNKQGGKDIVIAGWENGIAESPIFGHQQIINCDIFSIPGVVTVGYKSSKVSDNSGTHEVTGLTKWIVQDPVTGNYYALDDDGKIYKSTNATTWTIDATYSPSPFGSGQGLSIFMSQNDATKSFLVVARSNKLDVLAIASGAWTLGWKTIETNSSYHPMVLATDAQLYTGNNQYVASLEENVGSTFVPGTAATYTWNDKVLDLPSQYRVRSMAQLAENLMIGTQVGTTANFSSFNTAEVFPWDREAVSFTFPISFHTNGMYQLMNVNNVLYCYGGRGAMITITNGSTTQPFKEFRNLEGIDVVGNEMSPHATSMGNLQNDELLFGMSSGDNDIFPLGVYTVKDGKHVLRSTISTLEGITSGNVLIGAVYPISRNKYLVGWDSATDQGIDLVGGSDRWEDWSARIDTDLIPVSTVLYKRPFSEFEFRLAKVLELGQGIRIYWRQTLNDTFVLIKECTFASIGAKLSYNFSANIEAVESIQIRIELLADGDTTPWLREVRLR